MEAGYRILYTQVYSSPVCSVRHLVGHCKRNRWVFGMTQRGGSPVTKSRTYNELKQESLSVKKAHHPCEEGNFPSRMLQDAQISYLLPRARDQINAIQRTLIH